MTEGQKRNQLLRMLIQAFSGGSGGGGSVDLTTIEAALSTISSDNTDRNVILTDILAKATETSINTQDSLPILNNIANALSSAENMGILDLGLYKVLASCSYGERDQIIHVYCVVRETFMGDLKFKSLSDEVYVVLNHETREIFIGDYTNIDGATVKIDNNTPHFMRVGTSRGIIVGSTSVQKGLLNAQAGFTDSTPIDLLSDGATGAKLTFSISSGNVRYTLDGSAPAITGNIKGHLIITNGTVLYIGDTPFSIGGLVDEMENFQFIGNASVEVHVYKRIQ